ncbi:MAG: adenylate/guanylate cyclase domain-containing protein [Pseudomonadota bacterium]
MKCQECASQIKNNDVFCTDCGKRALQECPDCGSYQNDEKKYCANCGKSLVESETELQTLARSGKLDFLKKYMPAAVFDNLMGSNKELKGERRECSIIFADISGFTSYSEKHEPEMVTKMLNDCFKGLVAAVERYDGMVNKFIGDCIMAVFGAPKAHDNDPERAVRCAIDMQEFLRQYNEVIEEPLGLSIGVNTGSVVAGNIGSETQMEYTVIGDPVNLSQRLEAASDRGQILVGKSVFEKMPETIELRKLEPIKVKGKEKPVEIYEVLGLVEQSLEDSKKFEVVYTQRSGELKSIRNELLGAKEGRACVLFSYGSIGFGKTRLAKEVFKIGKEYEYQILFVKGESHLSKVPYKIFMEIIAQSLGLDQVTADTKLSKLMSFGLDIIDVEILETSMELQFSDSDKSKKSKLLENKEIIGNVYIKLLQKIARKKPLLFIVEDCHYVDESSLDVLKRLANASLSAHLALFLTQRSEKLPRWVDEENFVVYPLKPFEGNSLNSFIQNMLQSEKAPEEFTWLVKSKSLGNPLFIQEIFKTLLGSKKLMNQDNAWFVDKDIENVEIPNNLTTIFGARIDGLSVNSKTVIQTASVIGEKFNVDVLRGILKESFSQVYLNELVKKELILSEGEEYSFANKYVHEVAYKTNLSTDLEEMHLILAKYYEDLFIVKKVIGQIENMDLVANHYAKSSDSYKAIEYLEKFSSKLIRAYQMEGATEALLEILKIVEVKKLIKWDDKQKADLKLRINLKIAKAFLGISRFNDAMTYAKKVYESAKELNKEEMTANALLVMAKVLNNKSQYDEALKYLSNALKIGKALKKGKLVIPTLGLIADTLQDKNDLAKAAEYVNSAISVLRNQAIEDDSGFSGLIHPGTFYNTLGTVRFRQQKYDEAKAAWEKAIAISKQYEDQSIVAKSIGNIGAICNINGDFEGAIKLIDEAIAVFNQIGDRVSLAKQLYNKGSIILANNDKVKAKKYFSEAYNIAKEIGFKDGVAMCSLQLDKLNK